MVTLGVVAWVLVLLAIFGVGWRKNRCPVTGQMHDWLYVGPTADPATGGPYRYDRRCVACGKED
jgi:hypothetical protein